jgi:hypothetical protein
LLFQCLDRIDPRCLDAGSTLNSTHVVNVRVIANATARRFRSPVALDSINRFSSQAENQSQQSAGEHTPSAPPITASVALIAASRSRRVRPAPSAAINASSPRRLGTQQDQVGDVHARDQQENADRTEQIYSDLAPLRAYPPDWHVGHQY